MKMPGKDLTQISCLSFSGILVYAVTTTVSMDILLTHNPVPQECFNRDISYTEKVPPIFRGISF